MVVVLRLRHSASLLMTLKRINIVGDCHAGEANSRLPAARRAEPLEPGGDARVTRRGRQTSMRTAVRCDERLTDANSIVCLDHD